MRAVILYYKMSGDSIFKCEDLMGEILLMVQISEILPLLLVNLTAWRSFRRTKKPLFSQPSKYCTSVSLLNWSIELGSGLCSPGSNVCRFAAKFGSLDVLMWARGQILPFQYDWDSKVCCEGAGYSLEILKWLRGQQPPCPWDIIATAAAAAAAGKLEVLEWLHELYSTWRLNGSITNSTTLTENTTSHDVSLKSVRQYQYPSPWTELVCEAAASRGNVNILKWLRSLSPPCPWNIFVSTVAARNGHLETLKWLREQNPPCPWGEYVTAATASHGHINVLHWLREQEPPCPWSKFVCSSAAGSGKLEVVKWLRGQSPPCPWDEFVCMAAAHNGHNHILQWLRDQKNPCPWNKYACSGAAGNGHLETLKWLREQNCPWDKEECLAASSLHWRPKYEVYRWILEQTA